MAGEEERRHRGEGDQPGRGRQDRLQAAERVAAVEPVGGHRAERRDAGGGAELLRRFPTTASLAPKLAAGDGDERFRFGLDLLVGGLAAMAGNGS